MLINDLKKYLSENSDEIIKILELSNFYSISFFNNNQIRCAYYEGGNPTSVLINCDENLNCIVFSKEIKGDLFSLLEAHNNWTFPQTLDFILKTVNFKSENKFSFPYIFGGFYKRIKTNKTLSNSIPLSFLDNFANYPNVRFLQDHISLATQYKFNIRYDTTTNRIIVPWFDTKGNLVGISGRYNFINLGSHPKWKTLKNFSKGNYLYGLYENKKEIIESDFLLIGESEKFVMQLDSYGYHNAVALGNCNITEKQARIIKSLPVKKVVIALDEGINSEHILNQCAKLQNGIFNNTKEIWSIYDINHKILPKGSKASPTDFGKEKFEFLLKNCCYKKE